MTTLALTLSNTRRSRLFLALLAGGLVFLLLFLTRAAEQTRDSLVYALAAKTGVETFHPHHLIYTPVVRLIYQALSPLCPGCDAVFAGQVHNMLWAAVGIAALFYLLSSLWNTRMALAALVLFVGLRGYWELATQTTMYVPGAAVLITLSAVLLTARPKMGFGRAVLLGVLLALAILYHQANVLFVLPLGVYLAAAGGKAGLRPGALILALAGGLTLGAYLLVYLRTAGGFSLAGFIDYCLAYTSEICLGGLCKASPEGWGALSNLSAGGLQLALGSLVWNVVVLPERLELLAAPFFGLGVLALAGWHVVHLARRSADGPLRLFALTWLGAYFVFFWWWLPDYQHPFVVVMAPLSLLGFLALRDAARWQLGRQAITQGGLLAILGAALVLGGRNFQARILPLNRSLGDAYHEAAALHAAAPHDCVFLTSYRTWNHLRYYFDRQTAVQARHPLSFFTQGLPLPAEYRLADHPCVLAATTFLLPTFVQDDYSDDPVDAYRYPDRWLAYLAWLLDVRPDGEGFTSREFNVLQFAEGDPYLRLLPTRRPAASLDELFARLDDALADPTRPFQSWHGQVGESSSFNLR